MALPVFYIDTTATHDVFNLNEETSKHIVQVLRMKQDDKLHLTDGKGSLLKASIVDAHKKACAVKVDSRSFKEANIKKLSIAISLLKNASRLEWFLEKATEIGVSEIIPMLCERTEKQHFRYDRMQNILVAAMIQSQQVWLPQLHQPTAFDKVISDSNYVDKLIAHCEEEKKEAVSAYSTSTSAIILIGPEGDFTPSEIEAALSVGFKPVTLGNARLRTETAGVVAATLLSIV